MLWLGMNVSSCSMVGDDNEDAIVEEETSDIFIQLNLTTNGKVGTRAGLGDDHPYGGENGDGTEEGHFHENEINNINIFIYHAADVNAAASTEIKYKKYFSYINLTEIVSGREYKSKPMLVRGYKPESGDRIIVLVNMGDMTTKVDANNNGTVTLGEVRDALVTSAWGVSGTSINDFYNFAMSSAIDDTDEGKVIVSTDGSYEYPFSAAVTIERVAARIDFGFDKSLEASSYRGYIEYPVEGTDDKFRLSHIRMVNASQAPTYALKRTATTVNPLDGVNYLGDETVVTSTHIPNNYVVEPNTTRKKKDASITEADLSSWYGASTLQASLSTSFIAPNTYKVHSTASDAEVFEVCDYGSIKNYCYTLGYAMENTMDKSCADARVMTALQIKGTYVPAKVYVYVDDETKSYKEESSTPYTAGTDFWYFDNQTTPANSYPFVSKADLDKYAAKHPSEDYVERHYVKGECYYYVWIRHSMYSDPTYKSGSFPMEFGIVRNNIYRIYVDKVLKIGPEVPTPELPDLISSHIHVRDWRLRIHEDILL
ncbi:MAG: Mfa1 fimbrilin C-terminal domain-containing protein [Prevotellaceae bacterium]|nr:Mfa1 fimbrilin C-terminal domain-containing protein [Candidatus Colivivens caballi]